MHLVSKTRCIKKKKKIEVITCKPLVENKGLLYFVYMLSILVKTTDLLVATPLQPQNI